MGRWRFVEVTVIDGSGAPAYGPVNIFIKGNRIERIVSEDAISRTRNAGAAGKRRRRRRRTG